MNDNALFIHLQIKNRLDALLIKRYAALKEVVDGLVKEASDEWDKLGGCKTCYGSKYVLTWSTMDSAAYDEHGPCKDCTPATDLVGLHPTVNGPARSNRNDELDNIQVARKIQSGIVDYLSAEVEEVKTELNLVNNKNKLDYVIVYKGRKVPVGTHGIIMAFSHSQWGTKCCIVDGQGVKNWTDVKNVEGLLTEDKSVKIPAIEQFIKVDNEYRTSNGAPQSRHTVESLLK